MSFGDDTLDPTVEPEQKLARRIVDLEVEVEHWKEIAEAADPKSPLTASQLVSIEHVKQLVDTQAFDDGSLGAMRDVLNIIDGLEAANRTAVKALKVEAIEHHKTTKQLVAKEARLGHLTQLINEATVTGLDIVEHVQRRVLGKTTAAALDKSEGSMVREIANELALAIVNVKQRTSALELAALAWQAQGARNKWTTDPSLALWDAVQKIRELGK